MPGSGRGRHGGGSGLVLGTVVAGGLLYRRTDARLFPRLRAKPLISEPSLRPALPTFQHRDWLLGIAARQRSPHRRVVLPSVRKVSWSQ
jgi:hypothetical protein